MQLSSRQSTRCSSALLLLELLNRHCEIAALMMDTTSGEQQLYWIYVALQAMYGVSSTSGRECVPNDTYIR